jgi:hypothetical protein
LQSYPSIGRSLSICLRAALSRVPRDLGFMAQ